MLRLRKVAPLGGSGMTYTVRLAVNMKHEVEAILGKDKKALIRLNRHALSYSWQ